MSREKPAQNCVVKAVHNVCFRKTNLHTFEISDNINQFVETDLKRRRISEMTKKQKQTNDNNEITLRCRQIGREIKLQQLS